jgi:hypothetical protein
MVGLVELLYEGPCLTLQTPDFLADWKGEARVAGPVSGSELVRNRSANGCEQGPPRQAERGAKRPVRHARACLVVQVIPFEVTRLDAHRRDDVLD